MKENRTAFDLIARAEAQQLCEFVRQAPFVVAIMDREFHYLAASEAFAKTLASAPDALVGRSHLQAKDALPAGWLELSTRCLQLGTQEAIDAAQVAAPEGEKRWIRWQMNPWRLASGDIGGVILCGEEIIVRRSTEAGHASGDGRYRLLLDQLGDTVCVFDGNGRLLEVNANVRRDSGFTPEELLGISPTELDPLFDLSATQAIWASLKPGEFRTITRPQRRKDGSQFASEVRLSRYTGDGDEQFVAVVRDISDRVRAEAERDEYFQLSPDLLCVSDGTTLLRVNRAFTNTLGYTEEELCSRPFVDFMHPEDQARRARTTDEGPPGQVRQITSRWIGRSGRVICLEWAAHLGPDGRIYGAARDITERVAAEEALRQTELRYGTLLEAAGDGFVVHDHDGRFREVNRLACECLGYSKSELMNMNVLDIEGSWSLEEAQKSWSALEPGAVITAVGRQRRRDGSSFPVEVRLSVCVIGGERLYLGLVRDISERQRAQEEIQRLNSELEQRVSHRTAALDAVVKELEAFSYSVSHDLRSPLRGIDGWSAALLEDFGPRLETTAVDHLQKIRKETVRMGGLIDALLQLSRLSRQPMRNVPVNLSAIAEEIFARKRERYPGRHLRFKAEPNLETYGDPKLLEVLLTNLIQNAVKFTAHREVAEIRFGQVQRPEGPAFFVSDNGVGFDMKYADKLFGAFQRLHRPSEFPGTGIGLATVFRIVHRHAGKVWVDAKPDCGATFYFSLREPYDQ